MNTGREKRRLVVCWTLLAVPLFLLCGSAYAVDLGGTGSWAPSVDASNLTGGAGTNLAPSYESAADQITLDITNASPSLGWRVDVQRVDTLWPSGLVLSVRRTGDGAGLGSIAGGASYQTVSPSSSAFFSGLLDCPSVPVQIKLSGVSVAILPGAYATTLTFTVVETQ